MRRRERVRGATPREGGLRARALVALACVLAAAASCTTTGSGTASGTTGARPTASGTARPTTVAPSTSTSTSSEPAPDTGGPEPTPTVPDPAAGRSTAEVLGPLRIEDRLPDASGYRRQEWPHWLDTDGDGCDARNQALRGASRVPASVASRCKVTGGSWVSDYDGFTADDPGAFDVDHVVPLENAYLSGGASWSTDRRAAYANDQAGLWVVSASSNRSKGARSPDQWRPPERASWCTYARRWVAIKVQWDLTATSAERDALGQMLDTC